MFEIDDKTDTPNRPSMYRVDDPVIAALVDKVYAAYKMGRDYGYIWTPDTLAAWAALEKHMGNDCDRYGSYWLAGRYYEDPEKCPEKCQPVIL